MGLVVTVVIIVYNDAERLPTAIRSAVAQTLSEVEVVVVDDASTDKSASVARRFAAKHPDKVRVVELEENSGGCSRPRNVGIENARGEYVMFLDSDDTYEPDACAALVKAARSTGAEFVAGRCVRVHPDDGNRESRWCPKLFEAPAAYDAVRDNPDLMNDTLSTNKLYRRDFLERTGLRFTEGLIYEDLLFSAEAYLQAQRIAVIPDRVYNWTVTRRSSKKSITARRAELRNFADRIEVHRRVDALLLGHGAADLKLHKDAKFINHDLQLYVSDLRTRGAVYRREFQSIVESYLAELDPSAFEECKTVHGIMAYFLLCGDTEQAIVASDFAGRKGRRGRLLTDLIEYDSRVYWTAERLDTELGRAQLDVTDLGFAETPLEDIELGNELKAMALTKRRVHLAGSVVNPLGKIGPEGLRGELDVFDVRHSNRRVRVPVQVTHGVRRITWTVDLDVTGLVRPLGVIDPSWGLRLWLSAGEKRFATRVTADRIYSGAELPVRPRIGRGVGDHFETQLTDGGLLGLRVVARGAVSRATLRLARWLTSTRWGRRMLLGVISTERKLMRALRPAKAKAVVVPVEPAPVPRPYAEATADQLELESEDVAGART